MMKKLLFALPLVLLPLAGCEGASHARATPAPSAPAVGDDATVPRIPVGTALRCPVSHEDFTVGANTVQVTYKGKRYAFCCPECQPTFAKNPEKFAGK